MAARTRQAEEGARIGRVALASVGAELRGARLEHDISQQRVADAAGMARAQVSLAERGLLASLTIEQAARLCGCVGLQLSVRTYPGGEPIRDAPQRALLDATQALGHPALRWSWEVPFPGAGDLRAWDGVVQGAGWRAAVEAETRPRDLQALQRRLAGKRRDDGIDTLLLVLLDSRWNRAFLRAHGEALAPDFPIPGRIAAARLRAGLDPGGSSILLVAAGRPKARPGGGTSLRRDA